MAIGFPVTTIRRKAFIALCCTSRREFAIVLVSYAGISLALTGPPGTGLSRSLWFERNPWQQLTDQPADPPAPRVHFGSTYVSVAQLPPVPAAAADPVAGPTSLRTSTCDSPDSTHAELTGLAATTDDTGPDIVTLHRELPGQISDQAVVVRGGLIASDVVVGIASQVDRTEQSPESPTTSPPDCSLGKDCGKRAISPLVGTDDTAVAMGTAGSIATQRPPVWAVSGLLWPILTVALVIVISCAFRRQFRCDKSLLRATRAGLRRGGFHIGYQPAASARQTRCIGIDALLRWDN